MNWITQLSSLIKHQLPLQNPKVGRAEPPGSAETTGCLSRKPAHLEVLNSFRDQQKGNKGGPMGVPHSFQPKIAVLASPAAALLSLNVDSGPFSSIPCCRDTKAAHGSTGILRVLL